MRTAIDRIPDGDNSDCDHGGDDAYCAFGDIFNCDCRNKKMTMMVIPLPVMREREKDDDDEKDHNECNKDGCYYPGVASPKNDITLTMDDQQVYK